MQADEERPIVARGAVAAVNRRVLHELVADQLRDLITEGVLEPGAHLNERVLCGQLQVSRTPLREALRTLAAEAMVELLPNRGAVVPVLSRRDVEHAFELMGALEGLAGELAARRATPTEIDEVRALHFEMLAAHARRDLPVYYRFNRAIHRRIAACARNPMLDATHERLNARLQALRFRSNLNSDKWDTAVEEHGRMVDALVDRDGPRLGAVLRTHLENKLAAVLAQLTGGGADPAHAGNLPVGVPR